jgi:RNA polymerase sigma-70 factor, ECF subfamily
MANNNRNEKSTQARNRTDKIFWRRNWFLGQSITSKSVLDCANRLSGFDDPLVLFTLADSGASPMALEPDVVVQVLLRERMRLVACAVTVVRDTHIADDLFQQVVLSALEHRDQLENAAHVLAWALKTVRHRALDAAKKKQLRPLSDHVLALLEADWDDVDGVGSAERVEALRNCLAKLGPPAQNLLRMKYFEGLSGPAIAKKLNRTQDAVYQSLSRLHKILRSCVEAELGSSSSTSLPRLEARSR